MHFLPQDERQLQRALDLARQAIGLASPNPTVGCVITLNDIVLGEGAHVYDNFDHAEIAALKDAATRGHNVRGATAYVTLEPCSFHGRTGPCSDALIAAGIRRCVVATIDPNPNVSGSGIARMRGAGIEVIIAPSQSALAQEARQLNDAFAFAIQRGRPFITLKAALSVDGKLAPPLHNRTGTQPFWLTGEPARADVQHLRHNSDAILTGIGTVLADNPSLTDRSGLARRRRLLRVVLDSGLRMPLDSQLVATADDDLLVCCHLFASDEKVDRLVQRGVEVQRFSGEADRPDLASILKFLALRKINSVLAEAGSLINGNLLVRDLVDKLVLYYSETELGVEAIPFASGIASPYVLQQRLQRVNRSPFPHGAGEDVRVSGYLHDPWAGVQ